MAAKPPPSCPRCGYNQTGLVESWTDSCPLEGVCSECGLILEWRRVLNPVYGQPQWFVENIARPPWRTWLSTGVRALWPPRFWRDVRIEYPIQGRRLAGFAIAIIVFVHSLAYTAAVADVLLNSRWFSIGRVVTRPYDFLRDSRWDLLPATSLGALFTSVWLLGVPFAYLLLTDTLRQARVRVAHLWRGLTYALTGLCAILLVPIVLGAADDIAHATWGVWGLLWPGSFKWLFGVLVCWHLVFWHRFTAQYLRLTHPGVTAGLMLLVSGLFAAVITALGYLVHTR